MVRQTLAAVVLLVVTSCGDGLTASPETAATLSPSVIDEASVQDSIQTTSVITAIQSSLPSVVSTTAMDYVDETSVVPAGTTGTTRQVTSTAPEPTVLATLPPPTVPTSPPSSMAATTTTEPPPLWRPTCATNFSSFLSIARAPAFDLEMVRDQNWTPPPNTFDSPSFPVYYSYAITLLNTGATSVGSGRFNLLDMSFGHVITGSFSYKPASGEVVEFSIVVDLNNGGKCSATGHISY